MVEEEAEGKSARLRRGPGAMPRGNRAAGSCGVSAAGRAYPGREKYGGAGLFELF